MTATNSVARDAPLIVSSVGRSGSTLLQRLLNCHEHLTIWGEHGGFLKGVLEARHRVVGIDAHRAHLERGFANRDSVVGVLSAPDSFEPWVSSFDANRFDQELRSTVIDLFSAQLPADVRWGFKEIRYTAADVVGLASFLPNAHFVFLVRDMESYLASRFFAFGREFDFETGEGREVATVSYTHLTLPTICSV